jgi:hypothetical protein
MSIMAHRDRHYNESRNRTPLMPPPIKNKRQRYAPKIKNYA